MPFPKSLLSVLVLLLTLSGSAFAADLSLYSDKNTWDAGMAGLADVASKASGATVKLQDITPTDKYQASIQTSNDANNLPARSP